MNRPLAAAVLLCLAVLPALLPPFGLGYLMFPATRILVYGCRRGAGLEPRLRRPGELRPGGVPRAGRLHRRHRLPQRVGRGSVDLPAAAAVGAAFALVTGAVALRTTGVYFIMITLAFGQMAFFTASSLSQYGGDDGLTLPDHSTLFGTGVLASRTGLYYVTLGCLAVVLLGLGQAVRSRFGPGAAGLPRRAGPDARAGLRPVRVPAAGLRRVRGDHGSGRRAAGGADAVRRPGLHGLAALRRPAGGGDPGRRGNAGGAGARHGRLPGAVRLAGGLDRPLAHRRGPAAGAGGDRPRPVSAQVRLMDGAAAAGRAAQALRRPRRDAGRLVGRGTRRGARPNRPERRRQDHAGGPGGGQYPARWRARGVRRQDITRLSPPRRARLGLARSFQIITLVGEFTARENVAVAVQRGTAARSGSCATPGGRIG